MLQLLDSFASRIKLHFELALVVPELLRLSFQLGLFINHFYDPDSASLHIKREVGHLLIVLFFKVLYLLIIDIFSDFVLLRKKSGDALYCRL